MGLEAQPLICEVHEPQADGDQHRRRHNEACEEVIERGAAQPDVQEGETDEEHPCNEHEKDDGHVEHHEWYEARRPTPSREDVTGRF